MRYCVSVIVLIGISFWLCEMSLAQPKSPPLMPRAAAIPAQDDILPPKEAAARQTALQTELETLEQSNLPKEELETARAPLNEILNLLRTLEDARKRYATFRQQLDALLKRLEELAATQQALDTRQASEFSNVSEALRDQYNTRLHAVQTEIRDLIQQNSAAEARLAAIPPELEQRLTERPKLQQGLAVARRQALQSNQPSTPASEVSRLEAQLQLLITEMQTLEIERQWLGQRGPLHDALLQVAQTKQDHLQQDLLIIANKLGRV
ncbi:MAG: hypothetical protein ETSY1_07765 [Candidatus Entotheonella factor]|uniref:Mechanosensitive ion channel MscS porin domain-containing protein n=1 Tax=Entotheonella factor TaxID=1429438 RepID=W4LTZ4_ENTF1|nr:hypothetical protein [Candidatus Entotheonella palauensis]ETX01320.1 MAG: hypothetical protein ETSY1_07765 [Candidatus Entotheonella factor]